MSKLSNKIIKVGNRRTSMRLCCQEWDSLSEICKFEKINRNKLIELINQSKDVQHGLTYATRLYMLLYYKNKFPVPSPENINKTLKQIY